MLKNCLLLFLPVVALIQGCDGYHYKYREKQHTVEQASGITVTRTIEREPPPEATNTVKAPPTEIFTASALGDTAQQLNQSIVQLSKYQSFEKPQFVQYYDPEEPFFKYGLGGLVAIDWVGPIEALTHKVAEIGKYRFKVLGTSPPIPVLVNIFDKRTSLGDILRVANMQAENRADIVIYPKTKTIELRYKPA